MIDDIVSKLARLALRFVGLFAAISGATLLVLVVVSVLELGALWVGIFFLAVAVLILLLFLSRSDWWRTRRLRADKTHQSLVEFERRKEEWRGQFPNHFIALRGRKRVAVATTWGALFRRLEDLGVSPRDVQIFFVDKEPKAEAFATALAA